MKANPTLKKNKKNVNFFGSKEFIFYVVLEWNVFKKSVRLTDKEIHRGAPLLKTKLLTRR